MRCWRTKVSLFHGLLLAFVVSLVYCLKILGIFVPTHWISKDVKVESRVDRREPLIFIGGFPGSGTTLMRVLLDSHPHIRCGQETRIIPKLLLTMLPQTKRETVRLNEAGVTQEVLDAAMAAFIFEIISKHGAAAQRLCNKDPLAFRQLTYLARLFPNAKFILMVRDGRAVIHSIKSRGVSIAGIDTDNDEILLKAWSKTALNMQTQCLGLGPARCLYVAYEELVLHPIHCMKKVLSFVGVKWDEAILHHEVQVRRPGEVLLSRFEKSTDQVKKPIYTGALDHWSTGLPPLLLSRAAMVAPALRKFGYIDKKSDDRNLVYSHKKRNSIDNTYPSTKT